MTLQKPAPEQNRLKIILTGNPNVGKSVIFSRLTGLGAVSSNYPGTTVEYRNGTTRLAGRIFTLTDVPGAYSMAHTCKAEEIACDILASRDYDIIIHVIDALNIERNLFFALEVAELGKPMIILVNKWDIALMHGISIDARKLSESLGMPCLPFVAVTGEGIPLLELEIEKIFAAPIPPSVPPLSDPDKWRFIGDISKSAQTITHKHPGWRERLKGLSIKPLTGLPIAAVVMAAGFYLVRFAGEGIINHIVEPLYAGYYLPFITWLFGGIQSETLKFLLLGGNGAFGLFSEGVKIALGEVLAYVAAFYLVLGLLEDTGYLPRLSVLLDRWLHHIGLHGYGAMPILLGMGCKVPGIVAARVLETRRERIIAYCMALLLAPCIPQSAMIFALLAKYSIFYTVAVFLTLAATGISAGMVLNKMMKGEPQELFVEIPSWQYPRLMPTASKLWLRVKNYIFEAVPMILLGIAAMDLLSRTGALAFLSRIFNGPVSFVLGLPAETVSVMLLGFMRKDISIALLAPFNLGPGEIVTASVFLALYMPCAATLAVLVREAGVKDTFKVMVLNFVAACFAAGATHLVRAFCNCF